MSSRGHPRCAWRRLSSSVPNFNPLVLVVHCSSRCAQNESLLRRTPKRRARAGADGRWGRGGCSPEAVDEQAPIRHRWADHPPKMDALIALAGSRLFMVHSGGLEEATGGVFSWLLRPRACCWQILLLVCVVVCFVCAMSICRARVCYFHQHFPPRPVDPWTDASLCRHKKRYAFCPRSVRGSAKEPLVEIERNLPSELDVLCLLRVGVGSLDPAFPSFSGPPSLVKRVCAPRVFERRRQ